MLTEYEKKLTTNTIRRKKLFLALSILGVVIALGLALFYTWQAYIQTSSSIGIHVVVIILILLNARQNLRQYNFAKILETVTTTEKA